jgi:hypothetical protein
MFFIYQGKTQEIFLQGTNKHKAERFLVYPHISYLTAFNTINISTAVALSSNYFNYSIWSPQSQALERKRLIELELESIVRDGS